MLLLFFFFLSLSLASSLPSFLFLHVSLPPCPFQCCTLVCGKTKKEKMLSFLFYFFSVFCWVSFSCVSSAMKPFTRAPSASPHPSSSSLLSHVMDIMIVLPWVMIILQCEGHCSNNPRVLGQFKMNDLDPTLLP